MCTTAQNGSSIDPRFVKHLHRDQEIMIKAEGVTVIGILSFYGVICGICIIYIAYIIITGIKNRRNGRGTWGCCNNIEGHSKLQQRQDIVRKGSEQSSPVMKPPDEAFV